MKPCYDPAKYMCCAKVPGFPFRRVSQMTLEELQQTLCDIIANESFDDTAKAVATHETPKYCGPDGRAYTYS